MLYLLIRRRRFTTAAFVVVLLGIAATVQGLSAPLVFSALGIGLIVFTLLRLGLLTLVIAFTVTGWLDQIPMTFDFSSSSRLVLHRVRRDRRRDAVRVPDIARRKGNPGGGCWILILTLIPALTFSQHFHEFLHGPTSAVYWRASVRAI
jgi:hypothetical protein